MQRKNILFFMMAFGVFLVLMTGIWLATARPVNAQCGSSASSCKNCHEVQAVLPVNNDGNAWHQSHAFGDFCYLCHAGNNQATDEAGAHTGLVAPLSDIQASCMQCHPDDLQERAQVYASALGVEIGSSSVAEPAASTAPVPEPIAPAQTADCDPAAMGLAVDDPNLVDYEQRYDEIVLGKKPVNWGNVILVVMIGALLVGGGGFVVVNEKLVKVTFSDMKAAGAEYPADVVEMLPGLTALKPRARKTLKDLLVNPGKTEKVLGLIDELVAHKEKETKA